jgi:pimeloyl-ACP methyl ester carboxylesterase
MVQLGAFHTERVEKLVFLDALYEYEESDIELYGANPLLVNSSPPESFDSVEAYSLDFVTRYSQYRRLRSPQWDALMAHALERTADGRLRERIRPPADRQLGMAHFMYRADWRAIGCPVLAIYAFQDAEWPLPDDATPELRDAVRAYTERFDREHKGRCIARARRDIKGILVMELRGTSHYCFLDGEDDVVKAMRGFL